MRRYKRLLGLILLLGGGVFIVWQYLVPFLLQVSPSGASDLYQQENMQRSIVYVLPEKEWLEFSFQPVDYLKVLTNANVAKQSKQQQAELIKANALTQENYWEYTLQYQILNDKKELLQNKTYYHHTRLTIYQNEKKQLYTNAKYADIANVIAADGRFILINMHNLKQARYLRLKLIHKIPPIQDVSLRIYAPLQIAEHKLDSLWLRINERAKKQLAEGNVYNISLLTNEEKRNILKNRWQPLGPLGIKDQDYVTRLLYSYQEIEDTVLNEAIYPWGLLLDKQHHIVIPIPESGMDLQLKFQLLNNDKQAKIPITIKWFGRKITERWQKNIVWQNNFPENYQPKAMPGFIELTSETETPLLVKAYQAEKDITPDLPFYIKSYSVNASQPLEFNVVHNADENTAMRLDIRQIVMPKTAEKTDLYYQWLDKNGTLIKQDKLLVNESVSVYDHLGNTSLNSLISEPNSYYFDIPAQVTRLRLQANKGSALISAYNRYDSLIKINKVPEDFYISLDEKNLQPAWFSLNPNNWQNLLTQSRYQLISAQYRPPQDDFKTQQLLQGIYDWEEILPINPPPAQIALQTKEDNLPIREQALDNNYCSLPINKNVKINLQTFAHLSQIQADLIFKRNTSQAFKIAVSVDNKPFNQTEQIGTHGVINLPLLSSGNHQIKVLAPANTQVFINNISNCKSHLLLKRRIFPITIQNTLRFIYNKTTTEEEVLTGRFYTVQQAANRSLLNVNIQTSNHFVQRNTPSLNWSFLHRQFDMRLENINTGFFLYDWHKHLYQEQVFFIPLQNDLPIGEYQIEISLAQGTGYLTLSKTQAGFYENYKFYHQTGVPEIEY